VPFIETSFEFQTVSFSKRVDITNLIKWVIVNPEKVIVNPEKVIFNPEKVIFDPENHSIST